MKAKSREIKFRAWGRWGDWNEDETEREFIMVDGDSLSFEEFEPLCDLLKDKENECYYMQYIGLKDKNGKKVYVDFIYEDSDGRLWQILDIGFCESIWCYRMKSSITGKIYPMDKSVERFWYKGNIYENPELLK